MTRKITMEKQDKIYFLTIEGKTIPEICKEAKVDRHTVSKYRLQMNIDTGRSRMYL